jgi:hypothetical protein
MVEAETSSRPVIKVRPAAAGRQTAWNARCDHCGDLTTKPSKARAAMVAQEHARNLHPNDALISVPR